jgi:hypothetical protein
MHLQDDLLLLEYAILVWKIDLISLYSSVK